MQGMVPLCGFGGVPYSAVRKAAPHNLLDNSDFRNPVNQRGQTTYTFGENGGFTIDRWRTWLTGSSLTVCDGYISTTARIFQRIEHVDMSSTYTIAVKHLDGTISCFSGSFSNEFGETQVAFCYVDNGIASVCLGTDGTTRELVWAALYEGEYTAETLPEYQPKGYGAELAECKRYYQKFSRVGNFGFAETYVCGFPFEVEFRTVPTVNVTSLIDMPEWVERNVTRVIANAKGVQYIYSDNCKSVAHLVEGYATADL